MDSSYTLRPAREEEFEALWQMHREAFHDYAVATWGEWDEVARHAEFRTEFDGQPLTAIMVDGRLAGALRLEQHPDHLFVDEIMIGAAERGRGLGTRVMRDVMDEAARLDKPVRLSVFKVNPARRLYERLGFRRVGGDTHRDVMEWRAGYER